MIETRLECDHRLHWRTLSLAPTTGSRIWCQECKDMRAVQSRTGEWTAQCGCHKWRKHYVRLETMRDRVTEHIRKCGNPVVIRNHDQTEVYTVRTPHAAASAGTHSASVAAKPRVLPPTGSDTLF